MKVFFSKRSIKSKTKSDPTRKTCPIRPDPNLTWSDFFKKSNWPEFDPRWPETRDKSRSECPKPDLTRTRTTRNSRWPEIRWLETWPDPNPRQLETQDDPRSEDLKPDPTQTRTTRIPTRPNFKIFKYD
jgi:hypothetical protein